jgi:hypothetical protein
MAKAFIIAALAAVTLTAAPALADNYPISGRWGVSASTEKGPIDCAKLRVIAFNGNQRTDSNSGVPAYRNKSVQRGGTSEFRVVDVFTTGQISSAQARYTLKLIDADRVEMNQQPGGRVMLRKCK